MTVRRNGTAAVIGPLVVGAVELVGMVMVPLLVRVSGCVELDCLAVAFGVLGVAVLGCAVAAVVVLWLVARRPAWSAVVGAAGWLLLAAAWLTVALAVCGIDTVVEIVVADGIAVAGTVGSGYLAVDAVRRGGGTVGWFVAAAMAICVGACLIGNSLGQYR